MFEKPNLLIDCLINYHLHPHIVSADNSAYLFWRYQIVVAQTIVIVTLCPLFPCTLSRYYHMIRIFYDDTLFIYYT